VRPHILCKHKLLFWMRLIAINRLTPLIIIRNIYWPPNQHIRMISEGSCDPKDPSNAPLVSRCFRNSQMKILNSSVNWLGSHGKGIFWAESCRVIRITFISAVLSLYRTTLLKCVGFWPNVCHVPVHSVCANLLFSDLSIPFMYWPHPTNLHCV